MKLTAATIPSPNPNGDIEKLRGQRAPTLEGEKARLKKATKEFESFFTYYLLKTMRQTIPKSPLAEELPMQDSMGKELFTDMFDMEVSRSMTQSGNHSIGDIMYKSLEKIVEAQYQTPTETPKHIPVTRAKQAPIELKQESIPLSNPPESKPMLATTEPLFRPVTPSKPAESKPQASTDPIIRRFGEHIEAAARKNAVDSSLILSVIRAESGGNPQAVSPKGAKGLMQLADSTAQNYGVTNSFDPKENIEAGSKFLKYLLDKYQDVKLALAAYNAGPGNVDKYGGVPPFKETQEYVAKVTGFLSEATGLLTGQRLKNSKN